MYYASQLVYFHKGFIFLLTHARNSVRNLDQSQRKCNLSSEMYNSTLRSTKCQNLSFDIELLCN